MGSVAPNGVPGDASCDGAEPSQVVADVAAELVASDRLFWSKGAMLPPLIGSRANSTRAAVYFSGVESFQIEFGNFNHTTQIWTTLGGLRSLIGDLQAALVRAEISGAEDRPLVPPPLDPTDVPF
jgi:hypothetical protein